LSDKLADNPFCHLDNKQLAVFRSWLDDHWTWESDDPTSRRFKEMLEHAEAMQSTMKIYANQANLTTIEDIVADVIRVEILTRGDKDASGRTNKSLRLVAHHIGMRLEFFLGKDIVSHVQVIKETGAYKTS
jgi:hypothetical protein